MLEGGTLDGADRSKTATDCFPEPTEVFAVIPEGSAGAAERPGATALDSPDYRPPVPGTATGSRAILPPSRASGPGVCIIRTSGCVIPPASSMFGTAGCVIPPASASFPPLRE